MEIFNNFYLFEEGTVIPEIESTSKQGAIRELVLKAPVFRCISRQSDFIHTVLAREQLQSTGLGHGIAVAHGKTTEIDKIKIALGISRSGIEYDSVDDVPVYFLFMVANPPGKQIEYLMTLSALVRMVRNDQFSRRILDCSCTADIERMLMNTLHGIMAGQALLQHA